MSVVNLIFSRVIFSDLNLAQVKKSLFSFGFPACKTSSRLLSRHLALIYLAAAGKLTTERWESRFRRQFLPISRKWPELEARSPAVLAPSFLRSLISSPSHANMLRFFPYSRRLCWRRPPCEALFLRRSTPTCSGFSRIAGGFVGAVLPAKPYFFAGSRQHAPVFPI